MRIADLRHRLDLERPGATGWEVVATVWAALEPGSAEEQYAQGRLASRSAMKLRIRHRGDVTAAWRGRIGDRTFTFTGAGDPDGRRRFLAIQAEEETP